MGPGGNPTETGESFRLMISGGEFYEILGRRSGCQQLRLPDANGENGRRFVRFVHDALPGSGQRRRRDDLGAATGLLEFDEIR